MPGFNHTTENMKTKTLLGFFLLSFMAFVYQPVKMMQRLSYLVVPNWLTKQELVQTLFLLQFCILTDGKRRISG